MAEIDVSRYEKVRFLGRGTYGEVFLCVDSVSGMRVAVKAIKVLQKNEGIHFTALREIMMLQELKHPNIVTLHDIFYKKSIIHLVLELAEFSLLDIRPKVSTDTSIIKGLLLQLVRGIEYLHESSVIHRDLKPGNLLINMKGELKITDFGTAKIISDSDAPKTKSVCTLNYQSPETLFGTKHYGKALDIWSLGCIFGEMILNRILFQGSSQIDQVQKIFDTMGTPSEEDWPGVNYFPSYMPVAASPKINFERAFPKTSPQGCDLLKGLLELNPELRISARDAANHPYFREEPLPADIPTIEAFLRTR